MSNFLANDAVNFCGPANTADANLDLTPLRVPFPLTLIVSIVLITDLRTISV